MRIALLHYSSWPEIGGVENMLRDQATLLTRKGHEVVVLSGNGQDTIDGYDFAVLPELAPSYKLYQEMRSIMDHGQTDQSFHKYRAVLVETLKPILEQVELTIVHNIFTMHFNLALTQALVDLSKEHRMIAWTHDLVASSGDYALPNPTKAPWNLMSTAHPHVLYVAASEQRRADIETTLKPSPAVTVVPNFVDLGRLYGLSVEMRESLEALSLAEREFVFLLPSRIMPRKNVEFAIEIVTTLRMSGRNPLLLITGAPDQNSAAAANYSKFIHDTLPPKMKRYIVFVHDYFAVKEEVMRDLYMISDCLIYCSRKEGFGLPILEAALHRLPIWCNGVPSFWAVDGEGAFMINNPSQLDEAVAWLEQQSTFRLQRLVRHSFDSNAIYSAYYEPLLAGGVEAESLT
ncbi:MAG: glycosyltransferase family 4 protein [Candidatus Methylacidiphilales bacterium]|nr:glycosyltransferase family 4 protein [Candidatus Methylacidiphilales bacterium]